MYKILISLTMLLTATEAEAMWLHRAVCNVSKRTTPMKQAFTEAFSGMPSPTVAGRQARDLVKTVMPKPQAPTPMMSIGQMRANLAEGSLKAIRKAETAARTRIVGLKPHDSLCIGLERVIAEAGQAEAAKMQQLLKCKPLADAAVLLRRKAVEYKNALWSAALAATAYTAGTQKNDVRTLATVLAPMNKQLGLVYPTEKQLERDALVLQRTVFDAAYADLETAKVNQGRLRYESLKQELEQKELDRAQAKLETAKKKQLESGRKVRKQQAGCQIWGNKYDDSRTQYNISFNTRCIPLIPLNAKLKGLNL